MTREEALAMYHPIRASVRRILSAAFRVCNQADLMRAAKQLGLWADGKIVLPEDDEAAEMLADVALFEPNQRARRAFDVYLAPKARQLDAAEFELAQRMGKAFFSLFRCTARHGISGVWLEDQLDRNRSLWLIDEGMEASAPTKGAFGMRLFDAGEFHVGFRTRSPVPKGEASQLEQEIANFLTVQAKDFQGERRPWTAEEDGGVRKAWLNLGPVVKTAFPEDDRFRRIYALASAAVHGRFLRSLELSRLAEGHQSDGSLGVIVLERLCEPDEAMSPTISAAILAANLDHAERFGGSERAATDQMARQVLGRIDQPLIAGVDYTSRGTERDPFRIAAHLQFHAASYALLEQLGVDLADSQRVLTHDEDGNLFDRWQAKGREIWFHVDPLRYDATI